MDSDYGSSLRNRFLRVAIELKEIGQKLGYRIIPFTDRRLPLFRKLSFERQLRVVELLERSRDIYNGMIRAELDTENSATVVWYALNHIGLVPPSNFFDKITDGDVVEIYSGENFHQFANFKFFEVCSYTMEQIYSLPWPDLWHREEEDLKGLLNTISYTLGDLDEALVLPDNTHKVTEIRSPFKLEMIYNARVIAPVWTKKPRTKAGFVIIESAHLLNAPQPEDEEQMLKRYAEEIDHLTDLL